MHLSLLKSNELKIRLWDFFEATFPQNAANSNQYGPC